MIEPAVDSPQQPGSGDLSCRTLKVNLDRE